MRSRDQVDEVRRLADDGLTTSAIARRTGIPRSTVHHWLAGDRRPLGSAARCADCDGPVHDVADLPSEAYCYLLGQYLGDGGITAHRRTLRLEIACADAYPGIKDEVAAAIRSVLPGASVGIRQRAGCTAVGCYANALACLFPQHGPGRKHERPIRLAPWQVEHCERHPDRLLRGLIHADGCRSTNVIRSAAGKTYAYPRYSFSNRSDDILLICAAAFERVGVRHTWCSDHVLAVSRREDVARLDAIIGPKR